MKQIGNIENYYGGLWVKEDEGTFYWSIENFASTFWEEITETLYNELIEFDQHKIDMDNT